jgi:hypothetical protein
MCNTIHVFFFVNNADTKEPKEFPWSLVFTVGKYDFTAFDTRVVICVRGYLSWKQRDTVRYVQTMNSTHKLMNLIKATYSVSTKSTRGIEKLCIM